MKRLLSAVLTACLIISAASSAVFAAGSYTVNYTEKPSGGTVEVKKTEGGDPVGAGTTVDENTGITVTVTPDRMEITSLPGPDRTITNDDLQNRRLISRRYRNRRIGDFLKELKLVEGRNTGISTILHAMDTNGSDMPLFETDEDRTYFTVILPIHKRFLQTETTTVPKKKQRRNLAEVKKFVVITLEENGNLSTSELVKELGYTKVTSTLSKALKELMDEGTVRYLEPEKIHSRNQKICLVKTMNKDY